MFGIFKKKPIIEEFARQWLLDNFEWAMRNCGSDVFFDDVELVLPTEEIFPKKISDNKQLIQYVFETMKEYAGLSSWPIELVEKEKNPNPVVAPTVVIEGAPFDPPMDVIFPDNESDPILISYSPEIASNIERMMAAFAYDLSRIFCSYIMEAPPCNEDDMGHNTELVSVFLGFGIILANSAFQFNQYTDIDSQGWSSSSTGYLSQYELTYALAIFCELKSIETDKVEKSLKENLLEYFNLARQNLTTDSRVLWRLKNIHSPKK